MAWLQQRVQQIDCSDHRLLTDGGQRLRYSQLVVATGGLPVPKIGASDWGLRLALLLALNRKIHRAYNRVRELNFALPEKLDAILARCLAKNPDERFQTGEEMAKAIRACAASLTSDTVDIGL